MLKRAFSTQTSPGLESDNDDAPVDQEPVKNGPVYKKIPWQKSAQYLKSDCKLLS